MPTPSLAGDRPRAAPWWRSPFRLYGLLFCLAGFALFLQWPIMAGDTDLWFHLDYGRYLVQHRALPRTTFFSFISPPKDLVAHAWLFQVVVYHLHAWWGYGGLVLLRAVMYLTVSLLIFWYLFKDQDQHASRGWLTFLGVSCCLLVLPRYLLVRPHLFTYGLIVACLALLDGRSRWTVILPGLAVLWCNLQGITYPVLLGIAVSYGLEYFLTRLRGGGYDHQQAASWLLPLALSTLAVLMTPNGLRLLELIGVPAQPMTYESQTVRELLPINLHGLLSFQMVKMVPTPHTVFNVLLAVTALAAANAFLKKQARISHVLLGLGGALLLTKGLRFQNEFVLLALPLLKANPLWVPGGLGKAMAKPLAFVLTGALLLIPGLCLREAFTSRPRYPFSHRNLPEGVVAFLNRVEAGGAVLNHPNTGGYLRWRLYPRYRIFMDMENPVPFTAEDLYVGGHVFHDEVLLRSVLTRYEPSFLSVPLSMDRFPDLVKGAGDYVLVFFDDFEALYLNRRHHPRLAAQHALDGVNPFSLRQQTLEAILTKEEGKALLPHLPRLLEIYPDCWVTNRLAAWLADRQGNYEQMLLHAESMIRPFPESAGAYQLQGDALRALGWPDRALAAYRKALAKTDVTGRSPVYRAMGLAYAQQRQHEKAYRAFDQSLDAFAPGTSREDLYLLGTFARLAGRQKTAYAIFHYLATFKTAPDEAAWAERLTEELARLSPQPSR